MKKILVLLLILMLSLSCKQQIQEEETEVNKSVNPEITEIIDPIEISPCYPGGMEKMKEFIYSNLQYPRTAAWVNGRVFVRFIVSETGKISDVEVLRGLAAPFDEEAVRVITMMPDWIPGRQGGKAVKVRYNLPISFKVID